MDSTLPYLALNRRIGLARELDAVAGNVANMATTGYRREGLVFVEFVRAAAPGESLSMTDLGARFAADRPGELKVTGGRLDAAIDGPGFFQVRLGSEVLLTRAGNFQRSPEGLLVTPDGAEVLDDGGAAIFLPPDGAALDIASDGTISSGGAPVARLGVVSAPPEALSRVGGTAFRSRVTPTPLEDPRLRQGALEGSNVDPIAEIARLVEVNRAYEHVQGLVRDADERTGETLRRLGQPI